MSCITTWKDQHEGCPTCTTPIQEVGKCYALESIVENTLKVVEHLRQAMKVIEGQDVAKVEKQFDELSVDDSGLRDEIQRKEDLIYTLEGESTNKDQEIETLRYSLSEKESTNM